MFLSGVGRIRLCVASLIFTAIVGTGGASKAASLNIDFFSNTDLSSLYVGTGAAPDAGTFWNSLGASGSSTLLFSDGSPASGISVTSTFSGGFSNASSGGSPLLFDRIIASEATHLDTHTVNLTGLVAGGVYDLYAYAGYYSQSFAAPGATSATATGLGYAELDSSLWTEGNQYALLSHALADSSGTLVLSVTPFTGSEFGTYATIAGLQVLLSPVPLPPSLIFMLSAVILFGGLFYFRGAERYSA